ncbi:hypothetical protein ACJJTC_000225 [Scirpophaga incertulas]
MPSGEKILRSWIVYFPISNNLYCFCCRLFAVTYTQTTFTTGFQKWWKLNSKVSDHETSCEHLENFEKWKTLEMRLKSHATIDDAVLQLVNTEKQKWKNLLSRLLDITLFLAKQNLAFRGHDEGQESSNKGHFLELVKLLSNPNEIRSSHPSSAQVETLVEFMERNPSLAKGFLRSQNARERGRRQWEEIAVRLNSLGGTIKTYKQWTKETNRPNQGHVLQNESRDNADVSQQHGVPTDPEEMASNPHNQLDDSRTVARRLFESSSSSAVGTSQMILQDYQVLKTAEYAHSYHTSMSPPPVTLSQTPSPVPMPTPATPSPSRRGSTQVILRRNAAT